MAKDGAFQSRDDDRLVGFVPFNGRFLDILSLLWFVATGQPSIFTSVSPWQERFEMGLPRRRLVGPPRDESRDSPDKRN
jgi:hypothetical protein